MLSCLCLLALGTPQTPTFSPKPFDNDLARFKAENRTHPPAPGEILFIGSASFTRWKDVKAYFPTHQIVNRAFGGSTLLDQIKYVDEVVFPCRPAEVVIYCGENDFVADHTLSSAELASRYAKLFGLIRKRFPKIPIVYVSMKPSPSRWIYREKFLAANHRIAGFCATHRKAKFVDVWQAMLGRDGRPKRGIFAPDRHHLNASGYRIFQTLIEPYLIH